MKEIDPNQTAPGDAIATGPAGVGENVCPECNGTGQVAGTDCGYCLGRGKVLEEIAGA